jgi:hypothetical protein
VLPEAIETPSPLAFVTVTVYDERLLQVNNFSVSQQTVRIANVNISIPNILGRILLFFIESPLRFIVCGLLPPLNLLFTVYTD